MAARIGTLQANIILDRTSETYWGPDDPVQGRVVVVLNADDQREVFGPFVLKITFRGRTVQTFTSGNFKYKEQRGLFTVHHTVHDGPYRFTPGAKASFSFALNFPVTTTLTKPDSSEFSGYVYHSDAELPMPPSFEMWGRDLKAATEYRLGVNGGMPGISVKFIGRSAVTGPLLRYDSPRPNPTSLSRKTTTWKEEIRLPEWQFLPAQDRPNFLRRFADTISSREQSTDYRFDMLVTVPLDLYMNEPLQLVFKLQHMTNDESQPSPPPKIALTSPPTLNLWAETRATFTRTLIKSKTLSYNMTSFDLESTLRVLTSPSSLLTDFAATSNTKTVTSAKLNGVRPASFDTGVLGRSYTLQVEYGVSVAGKEVRLKKSFGVKVWPPVRAGEVAVWRRREGTEERTGSLPRYEGSRPPAYCEGVEGVQEDSLMRPAGLATVETVA